MIATWAHNLLCSNGHVWSKIQPPETVIYLKVLSAVHARLGSWSDVLLWKNRSSLQSTQLRLLMLIQLSTDRLTVTAQTYSCTNKLNWTMKKQPKLRDKNDLQRNCLCSNILYHSNVPATNLTRRRGATPSTAWAPLLCVNSELPMRMCRGRGHWAEDGRIRFTCWICDSTNP